MLWCCCPGCCLKCCAIPPPLLANRSSEPVPAANTSRNTSLPSSAVACITSPTLHASSGALAPISTQPAAATDVSKSRHPACSKPSPHMVALSSYGLQRPTCPGHCVLLPGASQEQPCGRADGPAFNACARYAPMGPALCLVQRTRTQGLLLHLNSASLQALAAEHPTDWKKCRHSTPLCTRCYAYFEEWLDGYSATEGGC